MRKQVLWLALGLLAAGCTGTTGPSPTPPQPDARLGKCIGDVGGQAVLVAPLSDVEPVWASLFGPAPSIELHDAGLLVVGAGTSITPMEGSIPGLGLTYRVCLAVGLDGSTTTHATIYSGTVLPLPSGSVTMP